MIMIISNFDYDDCDFHNDHDYDDDNVDYDDNGYDYNYNDYDDADDFAVQNGKIIQCNILLAIFKTSFSRKN